MQLLFSTSLLVMVPHEDRFVRIFVGTGPARHRRKTLFQEFNFTY